MTPSERLATLNAAILAIRPHGFLAESVLEPLQTLRDDMATETPTSTTPIAPEPTPHVPSPTMDDASITDAQ